MLRSGLIGSDERQVDVCGCRGAQLLLCLLSGLSEPLKRHLVLAQIDAFLVPEILDHIVRDSLVEVISAQAVVSVRRENLDHAVADLDDGDIKCAAAKVINHDLLLFLVVKSIRQGSCRRLVDDTLDIKSGDLSGILRRLSLGVIEVSGAGDNRFRHLLAQICFRVALQLLKDHRGNLLRRILLRINVYPEV